MHALAMNSPTSTSVEVEEGYPISVSFRKSKDRKSEERKKSSGLTPRTTPTPKERDFFRRTRGNRGDFFVRLRRSSPSNPVCRE
jgi:hypothetical protein